MTTSDDLLKEFENAKLLADSLKVEWQAVLCNTFVYEQVQEALPKVKGTSFFGIKVMELEGLADDQSLMFQSEKDAYEFIELVGRWKLMGLSAKDAIRAILEIQKREKP